MIFSLCSHHWRHPSELNCLSWCHCSDSELRQKKVDLGALQRLGGASYDSSDPLSWSWLVWPLLTSPLWGWPLRTSCQTCWSWKDASVDLFSRDLGQLPENSKRFYWVEIFQRLSSVTLCLACPLHKCNAFSFTICQKSHRLAWYQTRISGFRLQTDIPCLIVEAHNQQRGINHNIPHLCAPGFSCCVPLSLSWNTTNENASTDKLNRAINYMCVHLVLLDNSQRNNFILVLIFNFTWFSLTTGSAGALNPLPGRKGRAIFLSLITFTILGLFLFHSFGNFITLYNYFHLPDNSWWFHGTLTLPFY